MNEITEMRIKSAEKSILGFKFQIKRYDILEFHVFLHLNESFVLYRCKIPSTMFLFEMSTKNRRSPKSRHFCTLRNSPLTSAARNKKKI